jgi:hypothetical protein
MFMDYLMLKSVIMAICAVAALSAQTEPPAIAGQGYELVFHEDFSDPETAIDINNTKQPGFSFYPFTFLGIGPLPPEELQVENGALTISEDNSGWNAGLCTAYPADNEHGYSGTFFSGGAYFEATISFPINISSSGWPAFWTNSVEHYVQKGESQWPGQEDGYEHYMEMDFMEYMAGRWGLPDDVYQGGFLDWYGKWPDLTYIGNNGTGGGSSNVIDVPEGTDFNTPHTYGCEWVPCNPETGDPGYLQMCFDGERTTSKVTWSELPGDKQPPPQSPWMFGIVDEGDHYPIILGTGDGWPMTVYDVQVWQKSATSPVRRAPSHDEKKGNGTMVVQSPQSPAVLYDLQGRRIGSFPQETDPKTTDRLLRPGVYISVQKGNDTGHRGGAKLEIR